MSRNGWISVKDRLPEILEGVLVTDGFIVTAAERHILFPDRLSWTSHEWSGHEWEWEFDEQSISHWQPLPKPIEVADESERPPR